jgi:hypothetical protein
MSYIEDVFSIHQCTAFFQQEPHVSFHHIHISVIIGAGSGIGMMRKIFCKKEGIDLFLSESVLYEVAIQETLLSLNAG